MPRSVDLRILFNLIAVRKGGGMQVAANMLEVIHRNQGFGHFWFVVCSRGSEIETLLEEKKDIPYIAASPKFHRRFLFEKLKIPRIVDDHQLTIAYSYGLGLEGLGIVSVIRSTYSNLYFPDIDFWKGWNSQKRRLLHLKDKIRLKRTLAADGLIFENESMQKNAVDLFQFPKERTRFVRPSISVFHKEIVEDPDLIPIRYQSIPDDSLNLLMLTGWHFNKNIMLGPDIISSLKRQSDQKYRLVITVDPKHPSSIELMQRAEKLGVEDDIILFGQVPVNEIGHIYSKMHCTLLLSLLECYSSNIVESWHYQIPLLIANEPWSRAICGQAAEYVSRSDAEDIGKGIVSLENEAARRILTEFGRVELMKYNSPEDKVKEQIQFLQENLSLGKRTM